MGVDTGHEDEGISALRECIAAGVGEGLHTLADGTRNGVCVCVRVRACMCVCVCV